MSKEPVLKRRQALKLGLFAAAGTLITSSIATARSLCGITPAQDEGPFYPIHDQADKDMDLLSVRGRSGTALGKVVVVQGTVTDQNCHPLPGALVEIWQACASGKYNHPGDHNPALLDPHFQYWGRGLSDEQGRYRFRTVIPGAYPADNGWQRPPHIHFKVQKLGCVELITQMYFEGEPLNDKDLLLNRLPPQERRRVIAPIKEIPNSPHPVVLFDISLEKI